MPPENLLLRKSIFWPFIMFELSFLKGFFIVLSGLFLFLNLFLLEGEMRTLKCFRLLYCSQTLFGECFHYLIISKKNLKIQYPHLNTIFLHTITLRSRKARKNPTILNILSPLKKKSLQICLQSHQPRSCWLSWDSVRIKYTVWPYKLSFHRFCW